MYSDFGEFADDVIEFSIYNNYGELVSWETIYPEVSSTKYTGFYIDQNNIKNTFDAYNTYTNYSIVTTNGIRRIVFPVLSDIQKLGLSTGEYNIQYFPAKNVIGNNENGIKVSEISSSGTEISVICNDVNLSQSFTSFCKNLIPASEWTSYLIDGMDSVNIYSKFITEKDSIGLDFNAIKFFFNFKTDNEVLFFVYDIFNGVYSGKKKSNGDVSRTDIASIKTQVENYCYSLYNTPSSLDSVFLTSLDIIKNIIEIELKKISSSATNEKTVSFFYNIFTSVLLEVFGEIKKKVISKLFSPMKTCINLGNGKIFPVLNRYYVVLDDGSLKLYLKLKDSISNIISSGDIVYVTNFNTLTGIYQNISLINKNLINFNYLGGPNFNDRIKHVQTGNSGRSYNSDELNSSISSVTTINASDKINVDYRYFENFIKFSSVSSRLEVYTGKINLVENIDSSIELLSNVENSETDISLLTENKNEIIKSFDGYENFLYTNPYWFGVHTTQYGTYSISGDAPETSGSLYDRDNTESLFNNTPETIRESTESSDYVKFVNMVGHMFDNIWIYIDNFPRTKTIKNNPSGSLSPSIIGDIIESYGWECNNGNHNLELLQGLYNNSNGNSNQTLSGNERTNEIWSRIINTLPEILKTKGTLKCVELILACYGIPKNIIKIKETSTSNSDGELYHNDIIKYSPKFTKYNEYVECAWLNGCRSLELTIKYQSSDYTKNSTNRLVQCGDKWSIGTIKGSKDNGNVFFTIRDVSGSVNSLIVQNVPIFSGDNYDVLLRKYDTELITVPTRFELTVLKMENGSPSFVASEDIYLSGSFLDTFNSGSELIRFGNYNADQNNYFIGNIDEIKIWNSFIADVEFIDHSTMYDNFSTDDLSKARDNLICRMAFDTPVDLYNPTGSFYLHANNGLQNNGVEYIKMYNFREADISTKVVNVCDVVESYKYPYQFDRYEVTQDISSNNLYTSDLSSQNIKKESRSLSAYLSPLRSSEEITDQAISKNKIGVYFSPTDLYTKDKIKFTSLIKIDNLIGDPAKSKLVRYKDLESFKRTFNSYLYYNIDKNQYINNIKNFIDKSLFKQLSKVFPENANVTTGILIESTPLERTRIEQPNQGIESIHRLKQELSIKPTLVSTPNLSKPSEIIPNIKGKLTNKNFFENGFYETNDGLINPYGIATDFSPSGGYFMIDGDDYYVSKVDYKLNQVRKNNDGTTGISESFITRQKLSFIKFPTLSSVLFGGTVSGSFIGSSSVIGINTYHINGKFNGTVSIDSSMHNSTITDQIILSGSYVGIDPVSSSLISDLDGFNGLFITTDGSDIYKWCVNNLSGACLNEMMYYEKQARYNSILAESPLTTRWKSKEEFSVLRKNVTKAKEYNKQTTSTTIEPTNGLLDGSLPFYSVGVDSGRVKVFNQSSGNILNSN
jgi:hypothetical protein